eukprot:35882-Rhodomonas_salina.1
MSGAARPTPPAPRSPRAASRAASRCPTRASLPSSAQSTSHSPRQHPSLALPPHPVALPPARPRPWQAASGGSCAGPCTPAPAPSRPVPAHHLRPPHSSRVLMHANILFPSHRMHDTRSRFGLARRRWEVGYLVRARFVGFEHAAGWLAAA